MAMPLFAPLCQADPKVEIQRQVVRFVDAPDGTKRIKAEKAKQRAANKEANEGKADAVAAALARVKAKKAAAEDGDAES